MIYGYDKEKLILSGHFEEWFANGMTYDSFLRLKNTSLIIQIDHYVAFTADITWLWLEYDGTEKSNKDVRRCFREKDLHMKVHKSGQWLNVTMTIQDVIYRLPDEFSKKGLRLFMESRVK